MGWYSGKCVLFIIVQLGLCVSLLDAVSQWDSFCMEETVFTPYVKIYQKGRHGVLLRDRGPGFIDVSGLKDIYVCTNGLVMLYYTKTKAMGEIFEQGELHWAPHHCQLYNPSCNEVGADHPSKTLLSILLIGHPKDYRRPALQMFVAPAFDTVYGNYVNLTSLIMIGSDGECIIEKGVERARLRIRIQKPLEAAAVTTPGANPTSPATSSLEPEPERAFFCQLDSQRKLGQHGVITLANPDMYVDRETGFAKVPPGAGGRSPKSETGSMIMPRFKATNPTLDESLKDQKPEVKKIADEVYAALLHDRKMRFVGCLRYPDYSEEQFRIISTHYNETSANSPADPKPQKIKEMPEFKPEAGKGPPFWIAKVKPPWPPADPAAPPAEEERLKVYAQDGAALETVNDYEAAKKLVDDAQAAVDTAKTATPPDPAKILEEEKKLQTEQMKFSLWPLLRTYADLYKHTEGLETEVEKAWDELYKKVSEGTVPEVNTPDSLKPDGINVTGLALLIKQMQVDLAEKKYDKRWDPYNAQLVTDYKNITNMTTHLKTILMQKTTELGPVISNAEILYTRLKLYKGLLKKALGDLETAIKRMERSKKPIEIPSFNDPFDMYFMDTLIPIGDAAKADGTSILEKPGAKACYTFPAVQDTCKAIKPTSLRTCQLLKNRMGKGSNFLSVDDWRQRVFDLLESIFKKSCPYISDEFAISINRIVKGYLLSEPRGTGLQSPIDGSRLMAVNHNYQAMVYNDTYKNLNYTDEMKEWTEPHLRSKDPFWDIIIDALEDCSAKVAPMEFWHNEEGDKPTYVTFRKFFRNNNSEMHFDVEELHMEEKADFEYAFNWAVEMNWRIFATILGICMPNYENKIPLISARFYAHYTQDFLHPLRQVWMSNRDNPVLKTILGSYYGTGKGDHWSRICMESSFVESGDRMYRPPRALYVNAFTEMNYFTSGPMAGTSGKLTDFLV